MGARLLTLPARYKGSVIYLGSGHSDDETPTAKRAKATDHLDDESGANLT